jgi:hypothetical protein
MLKASKFILLRAQSYSPAKILPTSMNRCPSLPIWTIWTIYFSSWHPQLFELHPSNPQLLGCIRVSVKSNQLNQQISSVKSPDSWFLMFKIHLNPQLKWYFRASDNSKVYIYIHVYIIIHLNHWYKVMNFRFFGCAWRNASVTLRSSSATKSFSSAYGTWRFP